MKKINFEQYVKIKKYLNFELGVNETETKKLLTENELVFCCGNTGLVAAYWSDGSPALQCSSAGGLVSREKSAIIRQLIF